MRRKARVAALGAVVVTVVSLVTPVTSASAGTEGIIHGGCGLVAAKHAVLTNGLYEGVIDDFSTTTTDGRPPLPIDSLVTCWIDVNGFEVAGTRHTWGSVVPGTGIEAGVAPISFEVRENDDVTECETVDFGGTGDAADEGCAQVSIDRVLPQAVDDAINNVLEIVNGVLGLVSDLKPGTIDPLVCPVFVQLGLITGGGVAGVLRIGPDGDLYLAQPTGTGYDKEYDCPPYDVTGELHISYEYDPAYVMWHSPPPG